MGYETILPLAFLLLAPGPTNAMLATAGAARGWTAMGSPLAAVGGAYVLAVCGFGTLSAALGQTPLVHVALKIVCAALLAVLAVRLWWQAGRRDAAPMPPSRVFAATLANPKAFIIAMGLLPPPASAAGLAVAAVATAVLAMGAAGLWGALGALLRHAAGGRLDAAPVERTGAVALAGFAAMLTGSVLV